jgi:type I restriction enzyme, S subunit
VTSSVNLFSDEPLGKLLPVRKWKPYPAYKDSGVEWLGEIPAHWKVCRLKTLVSALGLSYDKALRFRKNGQYQKPVY